MSKSIFSWFTLIALVLIIGVVALTKQVFFPSQTEYVTATVELGSVREIVSVSGEVEAQKIADLAFPSSGVVTDVFVDEGSEIKAGDLLATLAANQLVAERAEAVSGLLAAEATYRKTLAGPRDETLSVANTSITNAEANLIRVTAEEEVKVNNARVALLSTGLIATTEDVDERGTAPTVSGSYMCEEEGNYEILVYSSSAQSGYSYSYSGLEKGVATAGTDQPAALGNCGLFLQFSPGNNYSSSKWNIKIPNTRSSNYPTLNNNYELTKTQSKNAIENAKNNLELAKKEAGLSTAPARTEEVTEANAVVAQARARVAAIDAKIADRSIVSPFDGIVTRVDITKGESSPVSSVMTVLADDTFRLKARIPEIDITKIKVGQKTTAIFDASSDESIAGTITYISPIATKIDGVAYFEVDIILDEAPEWLRDGLNADIDILIQNKDEVLRLPKRFVQKNDAGINEVLLLTKNKVTSTTVEVIFVGNDSFVEITGLSAGQIVVAP